MGYECWGDDHEDLTEKVEEAIARQKNSVPVVFTLSRPGSEQEPLKVLVTCAHGHENVFEIKEEVGD